MKYKISYLLLLALTFSMVLLPFVGVQAKPIKFKVVGWWMPGGWIATITTGPWKGYTMVWFTDYLEERGQRLYFFERWEIWNGPTEVLAGFDEGATRLKNGKFTGNGIVTRAMPGLESLLGLKEHIIGTVDFVTPNPMTWEFTATVQIN